MFSLLFSAVETTGADTAATAALGFHGPCFSVQLSATADAEIIRLLPIGMAIAGTVDLTAREPDSTTALILIPIPIPIVVTSVTSVVLAAAADMAAVDTAVALVADVQAASEAEAVTAAVAFPVAAVDADNRFY